MLLLVQLQMLLLLLLLCLSVLAALEVSLPHQKNTCVAHCVAAAPFLANARVLDAALFPSHCAPKAAIVVATVATTVAAAVAAV